MRKVTLKDLQAIFKSLNDLPPNTEAYIGLSVGVANALVSSFTFGSVPMGMANGLLTQAGFLQLGASEAYWKERAVANEHGVVVLPAGNQKEKAILIRPELLVHVLPVLAARLYNNGFSGLSETSTLLTCMMNLSLPLYTQYRLYELSKAHPMLKNVVEQETDHSPYSAHKLFEGLSLAGVVSLMLYMFYQLYQSQASSEEFMFVFALFGQVVNNMMLEKSLPTLSRVPQNTTATNATVLAAAPTAHSVVIEVLGEPKDKNDGADKPKPQV